MRAKSTVVLMLALGCGVAATFWVQAITSVQDEDMATAAEMEAILVADQDLSIGEEINVQMLRLERWPKNRLPAGAITRLDLAEGRRLKYRIAEGAPILAGVISDSEAAPVLGETPKPNLAIPTGFRAEAVKLDPGSGDADLIRPDHRVDVLVHVEADAARRIHEAVTRTILQDIQVFSVSDPQAPAPDGASRTPSAKTVYLLVTPEQAETLTLASQLGQVRLVMRSADDKERRALAGVTASQLLSKVAQCEQTNGQAAGDPSRLVAEAKDPGQLMNMLRVGENTSDSDVAAAAAAADTQTTSWTIRIVAGSLATDSVLQARSH